MRYGYLLRPMKFFGLFTKIQDIADHYGVTYANALAFSRRHEIPAKYDVLTMQAVTAAGLKLRYEDLIAWHEEHRKWRDDGSKGSPPELPWRASEAAE